MIRKLLNFLFLGSVGVLIGCAAMTAPDKSQTNPDAAKTIHIELRKRTDPQESSPPYLIKPLIRTPNPQSFNSPDTVIQGEENLIFSYGIHRRLGEKPPKSLINIVHQPVNGTLKIRGIASLNDKGRELTLKHYGWKLLTPSPEKKQLGDNEPEQIKNTRKEILHTYNLVYLPSNDFQYTDEFFVEMPTDEAIPQLVRYVITRQNFDPNSIIIPRLK